MISIKGNSPNNLTTTISADERTSSPSGSSDAIFKRSLYHIGSSFRFVNGRSWQDYQIYSTEARCLLASKVFSLTSEIRLCLPGCEESPTLVIRPDECFLIKGRYVVEAEPSGQIVGHITRTGKILGLRDELVARIVNPRSLGRRLKDGLFNDFLLRILGNPQGPAASATLFEIYADGIVIATITRCRWPFSTGQDAPNFDRSRTEGDRRWLPDKVRKFLERLATPSGWKLEMADEHADTADPRLILAAALLCVEGDRCHHA
ncbi:MAG: hypothetical protein H7X97_02030 [Opitutaceae bacterium]|nr:hypothetical protein [Verrucomicrobiales bacterium]